MAVPHVETLPHRGRENSLAAERNATGRPVTHDAGLSVVGALAVDEALVTGNAGVDGNGAANEARNHLVVL